MDPLQHKIHQQAEDGEDSNQPKKGRQRLIDERGHRIAQKIPTRTASCMIEIKSRTSTSVADVLVDEPGVVEEVMSNASLLMPVKLSNVEGQDPTVSLVQTASIVCAETWSGQVNGSTPNPSSCRLSPHVKVQLSVDVACTWLSYVPVPLISMYQLVQDDNSPASIVKVTGDSGVAPAGDMVKAATGFIYPKTM